MKQLLFLTDLANGDAEEDLLISAFLSNFYNVTICQPEDSEKYENTQDGIIIRNTWNHTRYGSDIFSYHNRFIEKNLNVYPKLFNRQGNTKDYIIDLYKQGFPVIPTVNSTRDIDLLPATEEYFIKPQDGFSSIGAKKISKNKLGLATINNHIIQPFVDFEYEISFYYIDKKLQHVLYAPNKKERWNLELFIPSDKDVAISDKFVMWNEQKYGIERIDCCRTKEGELLLIEISDQGGVYLSMLDLPEKTRKKFLMNLQKSIDKNLFGNF